jgi:hypothetical protein
VAQLLLQLRQLRELGVEGLPAQLLPQIGVKRAGGGGDHPVG